MLNYRSSLLILLSLLLMATPAIPDDSFFAANESSTCPSSQEATSLLDDKIAVLNSQVAALQNFIDGKFEQTFSLERYFSINPTDNDAVARQLDTLKKDSWAPVSQLISCFDQTPQFVTPVNQLKKLHHSLRDLKIIFFELPTQARQMLISSFKNFKEHADQSAIFEEEKTAAILKQQEAEKAAVIAENEALETTDLEMKALASSRVILEEAKVSLSQFLSKWTQDLKARQEFYTRAASTLGDLSAQLNSTQPLEILESNYKETTALWHQVSQRIYQFYDRQELLFNVPALPVTPEKLLAKLKDHEVTSLYNLSYEEAIKTRSNLVQSMQTRLNEENEQNFRMLLTAGQLRAQYIALLEKQSDATVLAFGKDYIQDLTNEIRIIPYRWMATFYSRILDVRQQFSFGWQGMLSLAKNAAILLLILALVFLFWAALKNFSQILNQFKDKLISQRHESGFSRTVSLWIPRINPYVPWVLSLIGLQLTYDLLSNTLLSEFNLFLPYLQYYIAYRIFKEFMTSFLFSFSFRAQLVSSYNLRERIQSTARVVGLFLFIIFIILHTVSSIARKGLLYLHAIQFAWIFGLLMLAALVHHWREEIATAIKHAFPQQGKILASLCQKWWGLPFQVVSILLLIIEYFFTFLKNRTAELAISKKISAKLFRRQIEKGTKNIFPSTAYELPEEYLQWFGYGVPQDSSLLIHPASNMFQEVAQSIENWKKDPDEEHTMALYGNKGSGKSCFLEMIQEQVKEVHIIHDNVPPKLITKEAVLEYVSKLLDTTRGDDNKWLYEIDAKRGKTLILLDECQNLFLAKVGGFEGFKAFVELINLKTNNIFWCMTFNRQSWNYLFDVFGKHEFYRTKKKLEAWEDKDIETLIEVRHRKSGFTLSYDEIISAATSSRDSGVSYTDIKRKFFQLLWEQSGGNPRAAIHLWLSSLTPTHDKTFKVGLPRESLDYGLSNLLDDLHFVYAQVVRHENLTTEEATEVTGLSRSIVSHALKVGLERSFLERSTNGRYRVTPNAQEDILKKLTAKNFIYGN